MSRFYEMSVAISGFDPAKASDIQASAEKQWPFDDWWVSDNADSGEPEMRASAQDSLSAGVSEEQFIERLSVAIWQTNGRYCRVCVDATYLENLPYESHALDESDYVRLVPGGCNPNT